MLYPDSPKERKFFVASGLHQNPSARFFAMTLNVGYGSERLFFKEFARFQRFLRRYERLGKESPCSEPL